MNNIVNKKQPAPNKIHGSMHVFTAAKYSAGGFLQLLKETAFKIELVWFLVMVLVFIFIEAPIIQTIVLAGLFMILFSIESLNTAIEHIVDEISPHRSDFAKHTKDLGSFAVFCLLTVIGVYTLAIVGNHFLGFISLSPL